MRGADARILIMQRDRSVTQREGITCMWGADARTLSVRRDKKITQREGLNWMWCADAKTLILHETQMLPQVGGFEKACGVGADAARALREKGVDVIGLAAGEPDFDTPAPVLEAGAEALRCDNH